MNDAEKLVFGFMDDILKNRPRDLTGETVKYNHDDRETIMDALSQQEKLINANKKELSENCYQLLISINKYLMEIIRKKII